jgi:hypothetical protein
VEHVSSITLIEGCWPYSDKYLSLFVWNVCDLEEEFPNLEIRSHPRPTTSATSSRRRPSAESMSYKVVSIPFMSPFIFCNLLILFRTILFW